MLTTFFHTNLQVFVPGKFNLALLGFVHDFKLPTLLTNIGLALVGHQLGIHLWRILLVLTAKIRLGSKRLPDTHCS